MARKFIIETPASLTKEQLEILYKAAKDIFFFATLVYVVHPVRGKVKFDLYPYQKSVLYQFLKERFNIILKFRQAGITELISLYCLWLCMFHPNKKVNIISIKDTTAKKVLKKIKYMYKNLPWFLQVPIINGRAGEYGSASVMEFSNGSFIESIPTSTEAGRSESLSLLVIDEAAIVRWASEIWAAAFPTLSCTIGSTPIILRKYQEIKTGYKKPTTEIVKIRDICPKKEGVLDISNLDFYTLTHKGEWKKILWTQNKGKLETWLLKDSRGKKLGVTPKHRLLTIDGWKTVEEIINKDLKVIQVDTKIDTLVKPKRINKIGSKTYLSKLTLIKKYNRKIYDLHVEDHESYISANNYVNHNTGGSAIINSTPYGLANWYHSTWVDAMSNNNNFIPLRLYWRMHPERDDEWYNQMSSALGPKRTAQEIDGDFLGSGNSVFDLVDVKAIEDCLPDYPPIKKRYNGQYLQFEVPERDKEYFIGADVATGRATDYSSFTCMDREGDEQAVYKGKMPVDKYAKLLGDTGEYYNFATLAPESNDVGLAVTSFLQTEGYPKLYFYQKMVKAKGKSRPDVDKSPGWLTTNKNRSVIIDGLENDIRNDIVTIKDPFFVQEAYTFIYDSLGRPVAMGKHRTNTSSLGELDTEVYADDDIIGKAITNHIRKGKQNIIVTPR